MQKTTITARTLADVRNGYLYATGDLVLIHETRVPKLGLQEYATLHKWAGACDFEGRVVLHGRGEVRLALAASRVRAKMPSIAHGSENTRRKHEPVGFVAFDLSKKGGSYADVVTLYELPGLIHGGVTVQDENVWVEPEFPSRWGSLPVSA